MRSINMKAARPAVFFLCAVLLTLAGCRVDGPGHDGIDPFARSGNPAGNPSDTTKPAVYTVTFDAGERSLAKQTREVTSGSPLAFLPAPPTKAGNTFDGWFTEPNGGGTKFSADTPITKNMTFYAKWLATVIFDPDGGNPVPDPVPVISGSPPGSLPTELTKTGFSWFGNWSTLPDGLGDPFTADTPITEDITVYAKWLINAYKVTFDPAGGNVSQEFQRVDFNTSLGPLLITPARTGNDFGGWYTEPDGGGTEFTADTPVTADMTVYAKWSATVTFDTDRGSAAPPPVTVPSGSEIGSLPVPPTKDGNTFDGWYTERNGGGKEFTASTPVTAHIPVYAKWLATVRFNANEGTPTPPSQTVTSGTRFGSLPTAPTKTGYTFGGWYPNENLTGDPLTNTTPVTGNMTVYAKWTINQYTVTFNADGGTPATQTRKVTYGSQIGGLPTPTRTGHTFGGWFTAKNGSGDPFIASTQVTADITVYAKWTINTYTVIFNVNGGTPALPSRKVNHGNQIGGLPVPTRTGNDFGGWYPNANLTGDPLTNATPVTANMTVYAKWSATVTFAGNGGTPVTQTRKVNHGSQIGALPVPTRDDYTFEAWFPNADGTGTPIAADTLVTAHRTVYAKWIHTVTFNAGAGSVSPAFRKVNHGSQISDPPVPTRANYAFGGWYTEPNGGGTEFTASTAVTANRTVYANWLVPNFSSLQAFLDWVKSYAENGGNYTYKLKANESIVQNDLDYGGKKVGITLEGDSQERTVSLSKPKSHHFKIQSGVTLTLGDALTLRGRNDNNSPAVHVARGGTLVMNRGSKICDNYGGPAVSIGSGFQGGGVYIGTGGTFTMNEGTITGNSCGHGGGVYVYWGGTFTMYGGTINGNTAFQEGGGGGVGVNPSGPTNPGVFRQYGGTVSGNIPTNVVMRVWP